MKNIIVILVLIGCASWQFAQAQSSVTQSRSDFNTTVENAYGESIEVSGVAHLSVIFNSKSGNANFQIHANGTGTDEAGNTYSFHNNQNINVSSSGEYKVSGKVQLICQGGCPNVSFDLISLVRLNDDNTATIKVINAE